MNAMTKAERSSLPKGPGGLLEAQPAPLTLMDRWILSRLAFAATCCNEGFESYNFPKVPFIYYVSTFKERWVQKHLLWLILVHLCSHWGRGDQKMATLFLIR